MEKKPKQHVRPSWDDYFMAIAKIVGTRSTCDRLRAGAVLVKDKRIISTGYNGSPPGLPHCDEVGHLMEEGHCVRTIHGEHNAILQAATVAGTNTQGSIMYTKYSPCLHCSKYIVAAGIKKVVMGKVYRNSNVVEYLKEAGLEVEIYVENKEWQEQLKEIFKNEIEIMKPEEGDVKVETKK